MAHPGLPRPAKKVLRKQDLLDLLVILDGDNEARRRILELETDFRTRIQAHLDSLPISGASFRAFSTSPYVLLMSAKRSSFVDVAQIEAEVLPAKLYSSLETSAGKMIEVVTLPRYGWSTVESGMHTAESALDGRRDALLDGVHHVASLKSGPRTLNDEIAENLADAVLRNAATWAVESGTDELVFTYGALYGTPKQSNKKDWHILRNVTEKAGEFGGEVLEDPFGQWHCVVRVEDVIVTCQVRTGLDWWTHLGNQTTALEVWVAMIRACVEPGSTEDTQDRMVIADLRRITGMECIPEDYNVSLLQRSQLPWLFLTAYHFSDELVD